jgi:hypothetical protein
VRGLLKRYAGTAPLDTLSQAAFYHDILLLSPQLETTVMVVLARDVPLKDIQRCVSVLFQVLLLCRTEPSLGHTMERRSSCMPWYAVA